MKTKRKFLFDLDIFDFDRYRRDFPNSLKFRSEISQYYIPTLNGSLSLHRIQNEDNSFSFIIIIKNADKEIKVNVDSNIAYEIVNNINNLIPLRKVRYDVDIESKLWTIDFFNNGMCLAEIDIDKEMEFKKPKFMKEEVTGDDKFTDEYIANNLSGNNLSGNQ